MRILYRWLWIKTEQQIDALITERILLFYKALVARGQIPERFENLPPAD